MHSHELRALRARLGLSRAEIARFVGVSEVTVVRWESGGASVPKGLPLLILHALRDACGIIGPAAIKEIVRASALDHRGAVQALLNVAYPGRRTGGARR